MNELATWVAVVMAGGGGSVITFITFWMALSKRIADAEAQAKAADDQAKSANLMATTAVAKIDIVVREINDNRVDMASRISGLEATTRTTTASLAQAETRLAKSIEDMGEKIDHLSETLIRSLSEMVSRKEP